ncbi:hypothetical protein CLJ1_2411 [Pseudomonas paraeruginosa]|nr:hypothetical protein CLJ1_2411 [Pseudomonas aeruginosa]
MPGPAANAYMTGTGRPSLLEKSERDPPSQGHFHRKRKRLSSISSRGRALASTATTRPARRRR